jgi:hypothetical protein
VAVFALVFGSADRAGVGPESMHRGSEAVPPGVLLLFGEGLVFALILLLFVAFLFEGYAFWSILLSTLHIGVAFGLIAGYVAGARPSIDRKARRWIDASMVWFVLANLGPLLLSGGGRMGQGWIDAWVGYYLTLAFNGWLTFAVIGLLIGPFLVGSWVMVLILIGAGAMQLFGHPVRTPLQGILASAGLIALAGAFFLPPVGRRRVGSKG